MLVYCSEYERFDLRDLSLRFSYPDCEVKFIVSKLILEVIPLSGLRSAIEVKRSKEVTLASKTLIESVSGAARAVPPSLISIPAFPNPVEEGKVKADSCC